MFGGICLQSVAVQKACGAMAQVTSLSASLSSICFATPASVSHNLSSRKRMSSYKPAPFFCCKQTMTCYKEGENNAESFNLSRRCLVITTIAAVATGFMDTRESNAAKRKAATEEVKTPKDDPNISGVQAKVLASMRRKEAMKESIAKLKESGKIVGGSSATKE